MAETTRYTLVTATSAGGVTILIGSPRDGDRAGIERAIAGHREMEREYRGEDEDAGREAAEEADIDLIAGCILQDEEPPEEACIVWSGTEGGWLLDEEGRGFAYAVLPAAQAEDYSPKIAEINYEYANHPESARSALEAAAEAGGGGWLNGTVHLTDGRVFQAGGGWLDAAGLVEPYGYRDAGEVDELALALGLDIGDSMQLLRDDCPEEWEIPEAEEAA